MATVDQLTSFGERHGIPCLDVTDALRARRHAQGWAEQWPGERAFDLNHLRTQVVVTARGAYQRHQEYPVELLPFCMVGHALRVPSPCRDMLENALDSLEKRGVGAVVLAWPATRRGRDSQLADHHRHEVNPALAGLLAAELAGAVPASPASLSARVLEEQK
jgi:hypothetical protein